MIELFQRNFDDPDAQEDFSSEPPARVAPAPPPMLTPAEIASLLDTAREEAYQDGFAAGRQTAAKEAAEATSSRANAAMGQVAASLANLAETDHRTRNRADQEVAELVLAFSQRVLPSLIADYAQDEIRQGILKGLACAALNRSLTIQLSPTMSETFSPEADNWRQLLGDDVSLTLQTNPDLADTDLTIDWSGGGLVYAPGAACEALQRAMTATIQELLTTTSKRD